MFKAVLPKGTTYPQTRHFHEEWNLHPVRLGNGCDIGRLRGPAASLRSSASCCQRATSAWAVGSATRKCRPGAGTASRNRRRGAHSAAAGAIRSCGGRPARICLDGRLLELERRHLGVDAWPMGLAAVAWRLLGAWILGSQIWPRPLGPWTLAMRAGAWRCELPLERERVSCSADRVRRSKIHGAHSILQDTAAPFH